MSDPIAGGRLIAIPFDLNRGPIERHTILLDHMAKNAQWFAGGETPEEARVAAAWMLTDASFWKWEIWSGGTFAGMLLLSNVTPKVNAVFPFTLLPAKDTGVTMFGCRKLVWNFLGYVFETFQLQRISVEIPEYSDKLAHWFRQRLGFRYEGQNEVAGRLKKWRGATILDEKGAPAWIAYQGSRRERAHWNGSAWSDLTLLRLLREEYDARALGDKPQVTHGEPNEESPDVTGEQSGQVGR